MPKLEPMSQSIGRGGSRRGRAKRVSTSLAEINVVPLVDVMLVLLVIFMVAAPMMQQGFPVNLPQAKRATAIDQTPIIITVPLSFRQDNRVRVGQDAVRLEVLAARVKQEMTGRLKHDVTLATDGDLKMQEMLRVWDRLKEGGVESINIQTQPVKAGGLP